MAKPRAILDLRADDSYAVAAAKVVAVRAAEVVEHSAGVLDTRDIEGVHRMRVATRRLRAALEMFAPCFPRKRYKRALKEVKRLADALGERRDRDVAIAALTEFAAAATAADRPGIESLVSALREEQRAANQALEPVVSAAALEELRGRLAELVAVARERAAESEPPPGTMVERERPRATASAPKLPAGENGLAAR